MSLPVPCPVPRSSGVRAQSVLIVLQQQSEHKSPSLPNLWSNTGCCISHAQGNKLLLYVGAVQGTSVKTMLNGPPRFAKACLLGNQETGLPGLPQPTGRALHFWLANLSLLHLCLSGRVKFSAHMNHKFFWGWVFYISHSVFEVYILVWEKTDVPSRAFKSVSISCTGFDLDFCRL